MTSFHSASTVLFLPKYFKFNNSLSNGSITLKVYSGCDFTSLISSETLITIVSMPLSSNPKKMPAAILMHI